MNKFTWSGLRCECTLYWQLCTSCAEGVLERLCVWNSSMSHQCWQSRAGSPAGWYSDCTRKSVYTVFMVPYAVNSFSCFFFFSVCVYLMSYFKWNSNSDFIMLCVYYTPCHFYCLLQEMQENLFELVKRWWLFQKISPSSSASVTEWLAVAVPDAGILQTWRNNNKNPRDSIEDIHTETRICCCWCKLHCHSCSKLDEHA